MTVGADATTYSATGLSAGATYYYRVRATNSYGDSANTSTASTTAAAGVPVAVPVPDGDFSLDAAANYMNSNTGGGLTFTAAPDCHPFRLECKCDPEYGQRRILFGMGALRRPRHGRQRQRRRPLQQQRGVDRQSADLNL